MNRLLYGTPRFGRRLPAFLSTLREFLSKPVLQPVPVRTDAQARRLHGVRRQPTGYWAPR